MGRLFLKHIGQLSEEPLEVYWLAGLRRSEEDDWSVAVALRTCITDRLLSTRFPIGALPLLSLGRTFVRGALEPEPYRGECASACIEDLSKGRVITSSDIDPALYSFRGRPAGVQRLFEYVTADGTLVIPAIELVRYLFLPNRTLAQCLMYPGAINLLYEPQAPGETAYRHLRFAPDLPKQSLTKAFVREFTWIALHPDARRAWDSVAPLSAGQDYVLFEPPPLLSATCEFRGVRHGDRWLVLEITRLGGRRLPCSVIDFSHPGLVKTVRIKNPSAPPGPPPPRPKTPRSTAQDDITVENGPARSEGQVIVAHIEPTIPPPSFENPALVQARPEKTRILTVIPRPPQPSTPPPMAIPKGKRVTAGGRGPSGALSPIEFRRTPRTWLSRLGTLTALYAVAQAMRDLVPGSQITATPCFLKEGRAFSMAGLERRQALVVCITLPDRAPVVLLDVERTGVPALALMAMHFLAPKVGAPIIEAATKIMLDALVDHGGTWNTAIEGHLAPVCRCERYPKALVPRDSPSFDPRQWAMRLLERLRIE